MSSESEPSWVEWYRARIGEPSTSDEVIGYWIFAGGVVLGVLGLLLSIGAGPASTMRELAVVLGATGLVFLLAGPIIRLPLRRMATLLTYGGVVISGVAILWFIVAFPQNWSPQTGNASIVGLYGIGVAVIGAGGIIVPLLTGTQHAGERALAAKDAEMESVRAGTDEELAAVRTETDTELASVRAETDEELAAVRAALDDAKADEGDLAAELNALQSSKARFELYEDTAGEWRWRLRHRNGNIIATAGQGYTALHNAQGGMQSVRRNALGATVLEFESEAELPEPDAEFEPVGEAPSQATFDVYEDDAGEWRWRLVHENGNIIADSSAGYSSKGNVTRAVQSVRQTVGPADYLWFGEPVIETYRDRGGDWRWRLVHQNGNILADGGEGYASHGNVRRAVRRLRETIDDLEFEVYEDRGGEHRWRARAANGELVADSGQGYASSGSVEDAVNRVKDAVSKADILEVGLAAFETYQDAAGEWRWRLRHRNGNILADSGEGYSERSGARDGIESVKRNAPGAGTE